MTSFLFLTLECLEMGSPKLVHALVNPDFFQLSALSYFVCGLHPVTIKQLCHLWNHVHVPGRQKGKEKGTCHLFLSFFKKFSRRPLPVTFPVSQWPDQSLRDTWIGTGHHRMCSQSCISPVICFFKRQPKQTQEIVYLIVA